MSKLGDFYNYLTFESYTTSSSSYGDDDEYTWATHTSCWAEIVPESEGETVANNQKENINKVTWKIRYDSTITENMRIYLDGNYYDIVGMRPEGRNKFLILRSHRWSS